MYRTNTRGAGKKPHRKNDSNRTPQADQVRVAQFLICLLLFLAVFIGKGVFPDRVAQVQTQVLHLIGTDADFRGAFSQLGASLSQGDSVLQELGTFCVAVFAGETVQTSSIQPPDLNTHTAQELDYLSSDKDQAAQAAHYLRLEALPEEWLPEPGAAENTVAQPPEEEPAVPALGTVILTADYTGQAPPENYTMDHISLGALKTATPLTGYLRSEYGYRDHPINGEYRFHGGIDIGGQTGDAIGAFADGTVDFIGEDDSYGLYVQLDHGNGIKSFYAHCSKLCVSKGQPVAAGEKIAEVGETGSATGPHLHLELKYDGVHLDPAYYVETVAQP